MLVALRDQRVIILMYKVQNEQHYSTLMQYASKILKLAENFLNLNFCAVFMVFKAGEYCDIGIVLSLCKLKIAQAIKR